MRGSRVFILSLLIPFALPSEAVEGQPSSFAEPRRGLFDPYQVYEAGSDPYPGSVAIGEVTGDGRNDVLLTIRFDADPLYDRSLMVFAQTESGTLELAQVLDTHGTCCPLLGVATGDLDGDGSIDAAVGTDQGVDVYYQNQGQLSQPQLLPFPNPAEFTAIAGTRIADMDEDGDLDIVCGVSAGTFLFRQTRGGFKVARIGQPLLDLEIGDITGDGRADVVGVQGGSQVERTPLRVLWITQRARRWTTRAHPAGTKFEPGYGIGVGDLNGDQLPDPVISVPYNYPSSEIRVLLNEGAGRLKDPVRYGSYDIPEPVEVQDVNGDGRADVLTAHGGWEKVGVYLQMPNGTLGIEQLYSLPFGNDYNPQGLVIGDVNSDGLPDIVLANYTGDRNILLVIPHSQP